MTELPSALPYPNARNNNEDFIKSIKDKYSTLGKPAAPSIAAPSHRPLAGVLPQKTLSKGSSQTHLDSSYLKDYQTLRRKYEERDRAMAEQPEPSTNKSSPIKHFYDTPKDDYLCTRRQEIEQVHQQRANHHRLEREKNRRAIADIDQLLASIRGTFSGYKYQSL